jgi:hypothetical protein
MFLLNGRQQGPGGDRVVIIERSKLSYNVHFIVDKSVMYIKQVKEIGYKNNHCGPTLMRVSWLKAGHYDDKFEDASRDWFFDDALLV